MRVISINTNGIRAAERKGFFTWLSRQRADFCCVQETKAQEHQLEARAFRPNRHHCYYEDAQKKGYSGVAIYSRHEPLEVVRGLQGLTGDPRWQEFDDEGRYLELRFDKLSVVSVYLPSGSSSEVRQAAKMRFLNLFMPYLESLKNRSREYILCGDWNIAHKNIDLKNWRSNQKNSGFLPEERAWLDVLFEQHDFVDTFRQVDPREDQYTWWSNRGQAWANNVGWRIDYQVATPALRDKVQSARIYTRKRCSDHAPLIIDYDTSLRP